MKKVVYITGCLGMIGFHLTKTCLDLGWYVRGIDKCTYAANINFLPVLQEYKNFVFEKKDIRDIDNLYECDYIINTAAETHVDNSIANSDEFVKSNIEGVHHLLKLIKQNYKFKMPVLLQFSTDEVYGDIVEGEHTETDLLKPSNPYSATKAAADMLILAWARTHDVPYIIVRPTNNYGIGQYTEKFIPHSIKFIGLGKKIPLHERGLPKRTWLHVSDTAQAIITIINSEKTNEIFNIPGNYEERNIIIAHKILDLMGLPASDSYLDLEMTRKGQDVRYALNGDKLKSLGWVPKANFDKELKEIVQYYSNNFIW